MAEFEKIGSEGCFDEEQHPRLRERFKKMERIACRCDASAPTAGSSLFCGLSRFRRVSRSTVERVLDAQMKPIRRMSASCQCSPIAQLHSQGVQHSP